MNLWRELNAAGRAVAVALAAGGICMVVMLALQLMPEKRLTYAAESMTAGSADSLGHDVAATTTITHISTPEPLKGVYMTGCIAGSPSLRDKVLKTLDGTEINALVVDLKDYTGTLAYSGTTVVGPRGHGCRVSDYPAFIAELHAKGIYVIGRITVFQDPLYSAYKPEIAVASLNHPGSSWKDKNGLAYIDPDYRSYWDYIVAISKEAHSIGFDEINFDYIRFPSDGDVSDMKFALPPGATKAGVITELFKYLHDQLAPAGVTISADLFGQTTVNRDDMGIGQILENALPYFDYVSPMNYPSHYINGFMGFPKPALEPYAIVAGTMMTAVERTITASSSVSKLRPWLQAFDVGAVYTPDMVKAQMKGAYDAGVTSWLLWDPANRYTQEEL